MGKLRMTMGKLRMTDFIVYQCLLIVRGVWFVYPYCVRCLFLWGFVFFDIFCVVYRRLGVFWYDGFLLDRFVRGWVRERFCEFYQQVLQFPFCAREVFFWLWQHIVTLGYVRYVCIEGYQGCRYTYQIMILWWLHLSSWPVRFWYFWLRVMLILFKLPVYLELRSRDRLFCLWRWVSWRGQRWICKIFFLVMSNTEKKLYKNKCKNVGTRSEI